MRSLKTAYLLMLPTLGGFAGLHRFYQNKVGTGILWLCTWGLCGFGTLYDALTMARQLRERDEAETGVRRALADYWAEFSGSDERLRHNRLLNRMGYPADGLGGGAESPEHLALRLAKANGGWVTPAQMALEGRLGADRAKAELEGLCSRGFAELRVRRDGLLVYVFPEFLAPGAADAFEGV